MEAVAGGAQNAGFAGELQCCCMPRSSSAGHTQTKQGLEVPVVLLMSMIVLMPVLRAGSFPTAARQSLFFRVY